MTKYFGKLAYIGAGRYGTVISYNYSETASGKKSFWGIRPIGTKDKHSIIVSETPLILSSVKFTRINNVIFCAAIVNGETRPGYAICSPKDRDSSSFGRRLALARAVNKDDAKDLLDEDFFNDYVEEYGTSDDRKDEAEEADGGDAKTAETVAA